MLETSEGSSYPSRKHWTKSPQTRFSGRGREQILYKVELRKCKPETPMISRPTIYNLKPLQLRYYLPMRIQWIRSGSRRSAQTGSACHDQAFDGLVIDRRLQSCLLGVCIDQSLVSRIVDCKKPTVRGELLSTVDLPADQAL